MGSTLAVLDCVQVNHVKEVVDAFKTFWFNSLSIRGTSTQGVGWVPPPIRMIAPPWTRGYLDHFSQKFLLFLIQLPAHK